MGTVGTLLLENPLGQNGLTHQQLLYEAAKVFGLRSRKLKLFLNETQTHGEGCGPYGVLLRHSRV
jgi:isoleucyl-tRNA synthetase